MPTPKQSLVDRYFKEGAEVEISGNEDGLLGSWFRAKIIRLLPKSLSAVVEYKKLKDDKNEKIPLREKIELMHLRPPPPVEERRKFAIDEDVDAYYHYGWWEGIVTGFIGEDKYVVFFRHSREQRAFTANKLRLHREWVYGKWHPALEVRQDSNDVVVDEVPDKSPKVKVPASKKRNIQPQDGSSTPTKVPDKSPKVKVPASKKRNIQPQDGSSTPTKVPDKSPKVKVPASKKRNIQPQDGSSTPTKVPIKSPKVEVPVNSPKDEVPASKKRKIQPRDDLSTPSKDVPLPPEMHHVSSPAEMQEVPVSSEDTPNKHGLRPGQIVEVSSDEEGFEGAWYSATLLQILNADKYLIKYQTLTLDDGKTLLIEEVDSLHIRPCPPEVSIVDRFEIHEVVDMLYNDGWWVGKISKVLKYGKYKVYFSSTDEEEKLKHSQLRVHQEWINGQWVIPDKLWLSI